ncbi:MAG: hypothetical protein DWQ07_18480 [Chloroflexi bacterium]|nr:MAG: hypothetical protein DWQ07_18480 [Chloroflexota bacterium]
MYKKTLLITVLSMVGLILAACGGGGSSGDIEVAVGDDFQFSPSNLSVSAGQEISLTFRNEASVEHTFNVLRAGEELDHLLEGAAGEAEEHSDEGEAADEHAEEGDEHADEDEHAAAEDEHAEEDLHAAVFFEMHAVAAGESTTQTFTAPNEAGDYIIFCSLPGHAEAGLVGTLTVQP